MKIKVISTGKYVPSRVVSNADFEKTIDTSDEWIVTRTGIKRRHFVNENENVVDLAYNAAIDAIKKGHVDVNEIDLIIVATITNQVRTPSVANLVQARLGLNQKNVMTFDMNAACSGFVYALEVASSLLNSSYHKKALIIGSEHMSSIIDFTDRGTCILFGDGAGAMIVEKSQNKTDEVFFYNASKGDDEGILWINPIVKMDGKEVYKFATDIMPKAIIEVLNRANLRLEEIDLIIPHQANLRIIQSVSKSMNLPMDKFLVNIDEYGNTSSASIPILIDEYKEKNKENKKVLLVGFGGGFTWGAAILNL
ncbi:beta-ketoacyl-ACP synthase III [Acholeplasma hippikon]|uniref:Beta-ketoacyl-[acyl-carrier-protein] synthase III n=1 Tax=Acholeplasma hippikon TaxID=264636 RepID=A0A449BI91_9MOLU|nr:beta-ketoacyl-ACP synthase III [Acholeplasma hippikon]VEU82160.1 3-oxoacyl-[acyl-carrier-protein] synthase 3 [Acholeplasma hippikon]